MSDRPAGGGSKTETVRPITATEHANPLDALDAMSRQLFDMPLDAVVQSEQLRLTREIHDFVTEGRKSNVEGRRSHAELVAAARRVVEARYRHTGEWEELSEAIGALADILEGN